MITRNYFEDFNQFASLDCSFVALVKFLLRSVRLRDKNADELAIQQKRKTIAGTATFKNEKKERKR